MTQENGTHMSSESQLSSKPQDKKPKPLKDDAKPRSKGGFWFLLLLILLLAAGMGGMGYYGWTYMQSQQQSSNQVASSVDAIEALNDLPGRVQDQLDEMARQLPAADSLVSVEQWQQNRDAIAQVMQQQQQIQALLQSLSSTTSSDWLLAEAEYLTRLAQQRVLMDHSAEGALALLASADDILHQVEDKPLFAVREQLQHDMTQLKLAGKVDRSGRFLQLSALAEAVVDLPSAVRPLTPAATVEEMPEEATPGERGLWQVLRSNFFDAMEKVSAQIRVRRHDAPVDPVLPPDADSYIRQNIALNIEQAKLALLREQQDIYRDSLQAATRLLTTHFYMLPQAQVVMAELQSLMELPVKNHLPDINGSLEAIRAFNASQRQMGSSTQPILLPTSFSEEPAR